MHYLIVSNFAPNPNAGAAGALYATQAALSRRGHDVDVLWQPTGGRLIPNHAASELFELPALQLAQVHRQLQRKRYDAVEVSQPFAYRVYEELSPRHPGTVFLNRTHGWEARVHACEGRWSGQRSVVRRVASGVCRLLTQRACRRTAAAAHGVVTACTKCAAFILASYGLPPSKVASIPHGVARELLGHPAVPRPASQRLLYVGAYLPMKGADVLQHVLPPVAAMYPAATMTFVIPGDQIDLVARHFRPAFGSRLQLVSWRDRSALAEIYAAHDILLMPSLFEGFHKVSLEAMASGLCVVGFDEGGLADITSHGEEALYCTPGDLGAYRTLLEQAIRDQALVRRVGARARLRAATYTWDRAAEHLEAFVQMRRKQMQVFASA